MSFESEINTAVKFLCAGFCNNYKSLKIASILTFTEGFYRLITFCLQSEIVFDLPSNTIDKAWMSILEIIYPVQWASASASFKVTVFVLYI